MKYLFVVLVLFMAGTTQAQLLNKLKNLAKDKVENKVVKESGKVMDSALDGKHGKSHPNRRLHLTILTKQLPPRQPLHPRPAILKYIVPTISYRVIR
ncbi:hypothetical protein [Paraflavitalea speifideaquila]|uniref:hypothetical protein n=1 Tax=Paraflavitalea speifideaquila TaxID=3076558 RepID=UPI0028EC4C11|nr:hypothetical protein [Paraflavitalea speifideiaquila]